MNSQDHKFISAAVKENIYEKVWRRYLAKIKYSQLITTKNAFLTLAIFTTVVKVVDFDWSFSGGVIIQCDEALMKRKQTKVFPRVSYKRKRQIYRLFGVVISQNEMFR